MYFAALWQHWAPRWRAGEISAARMSRGTTDPVDYCLSAVARVGQQDSEAAAAIRAIRELVAAAAEGQFFYEPDSLHITLLGCTQRAATPSAFSAEHIERVRLICQRVLDGAVPVEMTLKGVGVIGNQVFIQVFPHDRQWAVLRQRLEDALVVDGEQPLTHPNKAPIHLNLMRVVNARHDHLRRILEAVQALRDRPVSPFTVTRIDLLLTDFVVSVPHTTHVHSYHLKPPTEVR